MNDAPPDYVLMTELDAVLCDIDAAGLAWDGHDFLNRLQNIPKHIRAALAKRLMEDV